ncbi:PREDICTED: protein GAMETE EXPRESSED 1-like [Prunus mume]|uniref:Protein GAMETE EXPRESSED 1-like n=1 Tax=Prunus mume TaxID=102107 RepID=A0ABM1LNL1_PRUMU|nr:PREDICTED: protein GAMETE EXPRESSED 1-like [Prunus mume]
MGQPKSLLFLLIFLTLSRSCMSWFWSSSSGQAGHNPAQNLQISGDVAAEFSTDALNDERGIERLNNARRKLVGSNSCWHDAYQGIFAACSEIAADDNDKRKRFAWDLSNCFQKDSGRPPFPRCPAGSPMKACLEKLDNNAIHAYREFYLETNSICHQLQSDIFRRQTEKLVNELVKSSDYAEEKLETIGEKSEKLLEGSKYIHESLNSIDEQTQEVAQTSKNVSDQIGGIMKQSEVMFEQSEKIAASQLELQMGQDKMKEKLEEGMAMVHESYHVLGKGIHSLQDETVEIEKKIGIVGEAMSTKMSKLQSKADDIGNVAEISLKKQKELLHGQSEALDGLESLSKFQSQALEESRVILQQFATFGREQQEELLQRQDQIQKAHNHLVENSKSILSAQEAFEQKQATMFVALDRLFALHNALLLESRSMKAFFIYAMSMFVLYMSTSTKQTSTVRCELYIGLSIIFLLELAVLRFTTNGIEQQTRWVNILRNFFALYASVRIIVAYIRYKDYGRLNHDMLQVLTEEVMSLRQNAKLEWESDDESDWSTFVDKDVPDGFENLKDPNHLQEEVGDNLYAITSCTGRYNLRSRSPRSTVCF